MRVIYTAGVWDLLHPGHLALLECSRDLGDQLVVGVVSDAGCQAYKGRRPLTPEDHRLEQLRAVRWVDTAMLQETTDPSPNLRLVRPAVMTHGDDWQELLEGGETLKELGIDLVLLPYTPGISSSTIRERLGV